jgi:hypothetical protein
MPVRPDASRLQRARSGDPRYIEGQRILVEAIRYLVQADAQANASAVELLSDHFRTKFRMSDGPRILHPQA